MESYAAVLNISMLLDLHLPGYVVPAALPAQMQQRQVCWGALGGVCWEIGSYIHMEGRRLWESWSTGILPLCCRVHVRRWDVRPLPGNAQVTHALSFAIVAEEGRVQRLWKTKH